jgi:uncharacterized membrane protein YphA (DoxX/SURF4 family)
MHRDDDDAPLGELIGRLSAQTARLPRLELHLARAEATRTARHAAGFLAAPAVAAVLGLVALAMGVTVVVLGLATAMPAWLAALIVMVLALVVAAPLGLIGARGLARTISRTPRRAVEGVKEELEWTRTPS